MINNSKSFFIQTIHWNKLLFLLVFFVFNTLDVTAVTLKNQEEVNEIGPTLIGNISNLKLDDNLSGTPITDLSPLSGITSIETTLVIKDNPLLQSLDGLDNLESIGLIIAIENNAQLSDLSSLINISSLSLDLRILDNPMIENLDGLNGLVSVGKLLLEDNSSLNDISALSNLTSISNEILIKNNLNLVSLEGLNAIESTGDLTIQNNNSLISLEGISNINFVSLSLNINNNALLQNLEGLNALESVGVNLIIGGNNSLEDISALSSLTTVSGQLNIINNFILENLEGLNLIESIGEFNIFSNAALIDITALENLTTITENLFIFFNPLLENLDGLNNLESINNIHIGYNPLLQDISAFSSITNTLGSVTFEYNDVLENLEGLNEIQIIGGDLVLRDHLLLNDLSGLSNLTNVEGQISIKNNSVLENLNGLEVLENIGGSLRINNNPILNDMSSLSNVTDINNYISISNNPMLESLEGLNSLELYGLGIEIHDNETLIDISALTNLSNFNGTISIYNNPILCNCEILWDIQEAQNIIIYNNEVGCNSYEEVINGLGCEPPSCTEGLPLLNVISSNVNGNLLFTWTTVSNPWEGNYFLRYKIEDCGEWFYIQDFSFTSYQIYNTSPCSQYLFEVRYDCETSEWSETSTYSQCGTIKGIISTEPDCEEPLPFVDVEITGLTSCISESNENGKYGCTIATLGNLTINPSRDGDDICGVTTTDIIIIRQHILQNQLLDSYYKKIAADVNKDGWIATNDITKIKKLILGLNDEFAFTDSWIFVNPESFVELGPSENQLPNFEEEISISFGETLCHTRFVGVKAGDLNCSANCVEIDPLGFISNGGSDIALNPIKFSIGNSENLDENRNARIALNVEEKYLETLGFQMGFSFDPNFIKVNKIYSNALKSFNEEDYNIVAEKGNIYIQWDDENLRPTHLKNGEALIQFDIEILREFKNLSDVFKLNESVLSSEVVDPKINTNRIEIVESTSKRQIETLPIYPNPVNDVLYIENEFSKDIKIEIYNAAGQLLTNAEISSYGRTELIMSEYKSGVYLIKYFDDDQNRIVMKKVVKLTD